MSDVSHRQRGDLAGHPDEREMRERYSRVMGGRDVVFADGPVFLAGLYAAVSAWAVHFNDSQPELATTNLIAGIAVALLALGFSRAPERMYGMSHAIVVIGAWLIVSPWLVGDGPDAGIILSNVITGGIICLLGLVCAAAALKAHRSSSRGAGHAPRG
ncbi:SPW repeat protein [Streptomyces johnsoniae]|uniref:SPW repeat protein n=1 Tax=Streptomyces johnsoniae TaxID=3075532 RepID=A0ABU2S5G6_9ACTN|nr:SPW repeat protein [Streptomyces sp. DSM 41886]MDT0444157.1 SPW repeat protein [Streptomyces sp. DSM 41886]